MYRRRRNGSSRRNVARQQGFKTYSSRVGGGFIQPRVTRAPRLERAKFLDMAWSNATLADTNYWSANALSASHSDEPLVPTTQLTSNKRALNLVVNGSANNDRVSARIMMKSILLRGTMFYDPIRAADGSAIPIGTLTRGSDGNSAPIEVQDVDRSVTVFIVYYPRVKLDQYPTFASLLETPVTTYSGLDETNTLGARVLLRKTFRLRITPLGGTPTAPVYGLGAGSRRDFAWKLNLNLPSEWDNSPPGGPSFSTMRSGQLVLFFMSNQPSTGAVPITPASARSPKMSVRCRLAFVDA